MIERKFKPASFTVANPKLPNQGPPTKKQKINLNSISFSGANNNRHNFSGNVSRGGRSGGGRYSGRNILGGRYSNRQNFQQNNCQHNRQGN
jgi:hypothetical protein